MVDDQTTVHCRLMKIAVTSSTAVYVVRSVSGSIRLIDPSLGTLLTGALLDDSARLVRMATMASLASSCSAWLECDALRARGPPAESAVRRGSGVVRCAQAKSDGEVSRRQAACALLAGALVLPVAPMARALLEADDDDSLLEKVKEDKKKRIQKRSTAINEFVKESGVVQVAVYKLSEAGQAIDGGDFSKATSVLAQQNAVWVRDIQEALNKVSSNSDEKAVAENFRSALSTLQAAVKSGDSSSSRTAFIASAEALDKWTRLTGLSEKVVGL